MLRFVTFNQLSLRELLVANQTPKGGSHLLSSVEVHAYERI